MRKIKLFTLITCLCMLVGFVNAQTDPGTTNLKHQWTFDDGTVNDAVLTNPVNGTLMGGAVVDGTTKALKLTAAGQYLSLSGTDLALNTYPALTLEAWVTSTNTNSGNPMLSYFGNVNGTVGAQGVFITTTSRTAISCVNLTSPWSSEDNVNGTVSNSNGLHHLVSIITATDISFYVDGILDGVTPLRVGNSIANIGTGVAYLAKSGYTADATWQGSLNKYSIYNKALSADEVKYLFLKGAEDSKPFIKVSVANLELSASTSFKVNSNNLTAPITITAPAGITMVASLPQNVFNPTSVAVTYDGTTAVNGNIYLTSGLTVDTIPIKADPTAFNFTPLYPSGNLIIDPYCNFYIKDGWGGKGLNTNLAYVYSGLSSGSVLVTTGSYDRLLNGIMKPNTHYRIKAKVYKVSGTLGIGVYGWNNTAADLFTAASTTAAWETIDYQFTTGPILKQGGQGTFFNGGFGYIDNWELYEDTPTTWTGATSTDWADATNWSNGVPTADLNAVIPVTTNQPTLSTTTTVNFLQINSGVTLTNSGNLQITGSPIINGVISGAGTTTLNGTKGQAIFGVGQFGNLVVSDTLGVTLNGATTINGDLTLTSAKCVLTTGANVLTLKGATSGLGFIATGTTGTIAYNGTSAQTVSNLTAGAVNNLIINNTAGVSLTAATTYSGTLTLTNGALTNGAFLTVATGKTIVITAGSLVTAPTYAGTVNLTYNNTAATTTGVEIPTTATVLSNLIINNAAGVTLNSAATINGTLTLTLGAFNNGANLTFATGKAIIVTAGTLTNAPTFAGTIDITYNNTVAQTTGVEIPVSATTLNNLIINNVGGVTLNSAATVNGTLTLTNGVFTNGAYLTIADTKTIVRTAGSLVTAPTFGATVNVTFNNTVATVTGPELPTATTVLSTLIINNAGGVSLNAPIIVNGTLTLTNGVLNNTTNSVTMANATTISVAAGSLTAIPVFGTSINLIYNNTVSTTTSYEMPTVATVLTNLTVNNTVGVVLNAAITVNGTLALTKGVVTNTTNNVTLANGATITRAAGSLSTAPVFGATVNLFYNNSAALTTANEIPTGATVLNNLTIAGATGLVLNVPVTVNGIMLMTTGKVTLGANNLTIASTGSISGPTSAKFIITNGAGKLTQTILAATAKLFPIGPSSASYDPASVTATTATDFSAKVGTTLSGTAASGIMYNAKEWLLTAVTPSSTEITFTPSAVTATGVYPIIAQYVGSAYVNSPAVKTGTSYVGTYSTFGSFVTGTSDVYTSVSAPAVGLIVYAEGNTLNVKGTNVGDEVSIYAVNGQKLVKQVATGDYFSTTLQQGVYVINVNASGVLKTFKAIVK